MLDSDFKHNFHTHTFRCKHARGETEDYCEAALQRGMKTLGFSDHSALPDNRWISARMHYDELADYVEAVNRAKRSYSNLRILLGMECEYIPEFQSFYEDELFGEYKFDYLVGGPHFFTDDYGNWRGTYSGAVDAKALCHYGRYVQSMIESNLFDFIAHPDLFGVCYSTWDADTASCSRDILAAAQECGVGLEINALGLEKIARRKPSNPFPLYPWEPFWELAADYDIEAIVNADAHRPEDLNRRTGAAEAIRVKFGLKAMDPNAIGDRNEVRNSYA
ncbi:MAG: histidinol-phosphatase [Gammaproteobacteria bacterium]|nr:histidinol-phosphatase [Gammaproteobacteria bacterium]